MEPIRQNDYYAIFQTGLLIAVEELGVKQTHLAAVCGVSKGYLSKLKGWSMDNKSGTLLARPHATSTNFRIYAVPLLQYLEQEHQIVFSEGYFGPTQTNAGARQWGDIKSMLLPDPVNQNGHTGVPPPDILEEIDIPETGEMTIEWNIDLTDQNNLQAMLEKIERLADKANAQMSIKIVLRKKLKRPGTMLYKNQRRRETPSEFEDNLELPAHEFETNPYLHLHVKEGYNRFSEQVYVKDSRNGAQREQFCDYSAWEALHRQGDWDYSPEMRIIHGGGVHQYLLSRYRYGAHPFNLQAVLRFDGYAQHAGAHTETANAGLLLGYQSVGGKVQYFHLLLDGQTMRLELVGAQAGDALSDYQHLDAGVPFVIDDGAEYQFLLRVTPETIEVFVDSVLCYQVATPPGMEGQVGIRPWRARVTCSYFEIWEER